MDESGQIAAIAIVSRGSFARTRVKKIANDSSLQVPSVNLPRSRKYIKATGHLAWYIRVKIRLNFDFE